VINGVECINGSIDFFLVWVSCFSTDFSSSTFNTKICFFNYHVYNMITLLSAFFVWAQMWRCANFAFKINLHFWIIYLRFQFILSPNYLISFLPIADLYPHFRYFYLQTYLHFRTFYFNKYYYPVLRHVGKVVKSEIFASKISLSSLNV